jgi:uncharacterized protein (DUF2164 family)
MNLKSKKIIAREFLFLISSVVIAVLVFVGIHIYNQILKEEIRQIEDSIAALRDELDKIEEPYAKKIEEQHRLFESAGYDIENGNEHSKIWARLVELGKADSIVHKWNFVWNNDLKETFKEIGLNTGEEVNQFVINNTLNIRELQSEFEADSLRSIAQRLRLQYARSITKPVEYEEKLHIIFLTLVGVLTII